MPYILSYHFEQVLTDITSISGEVSVRQALEEISSKPKMYYRLHNWALTHDGLSLREWSFFALELIEHLGMSKDELDRLGKRAPTKKDLTSIAKEICAVDECLYEKNSSTGRRGQELAKLEVDHIWPWSLGGPTVYWNLQFLCYGHNKMKANSISLDKFMQPEFLRFVKAHLQNEAYKRGVVL